MAYGYQNGNPFGDPNGFNKHTQADEVDRFNQYLRTLPEWQQIKGTANGFGDDQKKQLAQVLQSKYGIAVPHELHIDDAGNFNQSRTAGDWGKLALKGAAIGGLAATGLGAAGIGPMAGLFGGTAATSAVGGAVPALEGGGTLAANLAGAGALPALTAGGGAAAATGLGSRLAGVLTNPNVLRAAGTGAAAYADSAAHNRGVGLDATQNEDQLRLLAARDNRAGEADAMHNLAVSNYLQNYKAPERPAYLPPSGLKGPTPPSDAQKTAAKALEAEMLARIQSGGTKLTDVNQYMKPGTGERIASILGPAAAAYSMFRR